METNKNEVVVKCWDNCSCLSVDVWDEDKDIEKEYFITFYNNYNDTSFRKKIVDIWKIIRGKKIYNQDLILDEEDFDKIRNFK